MRRRDFIKVIGGTAVGWPHVVLAQQPAMPVVGFLNSATADGYASMAEAFRQGLRESGYVEGNNVGIEYRWAANQYDRLPALAADLVARRVRVIFANSPCVDAVKTATSTIPIVFMTGDDPVHLGWVASFNKPGGHITGVTILSGELAAKRLGLLHELVPRARDIAVLVDPNGPAAKRFQAEVKTAASLLGLAIRVWPTSNEREIEHAFEELARVRAGALLVGPGPFLDSRRDLLVARAAKIAIPAAYETRATAIAGGLTSYGPSVGNGYRLAGTYTGRILKSEKPANLPILQPTKFELYFNRKTAKALGLQIPDKLLALADEVIE